VAQILSAICSPKTDNIVYVTRGGFWMAKCAKRWVNSDEGFLGLTTSALSQKFFGKLSRDFPALLRARSRQLYQVAIDIRPLPIQKIRAQFS